MATLNLVKPSASSQAILPITDQVTDYTFDFDLFDAIIEKIDENLVISFDADGSSIVLEGFYAVYNAEFMPNFVLDGELVSGEDFFNAMDPNLMPAAGPAAGEVVQDSNGVYSTGGRDLDGGVNALGGRSGGSDYDVDPNLLEGGGSQGGGSQGGDNTPPDVEPTLSFDDDPTKDVLNAQLTTYDDASEEHGRTDTGSFTFTPGNGFTDVTVNGESIFDENGDFVGGTFKGEEGSLTITGYDPATGKVDYEYTQNEASTHPKDNVLQDKFEIEVTDQDGDSVTGSITVDIIDDVPVAKGDVNNTTEGLEIKGNILNNDEASADGGDVLGKELVEVKLPQDMIDNGWTASGSLENNDLTFEHADKGTITFDKDGDYTFTPKDNVYKNEAEDLTFDYTIKDTDGDTSSSTLDITLSDEVSGSGDETVLNLTATPNVAEGKTDGVNNTITYKVEISNTPKEDVVVEVTDYLGNKHQVTIKAGDLFAEVTVDAPSDDVYIDADSVTGTLDSIVSGADQFESLVIGNDKATTNVTDTTDTSTLTLKAGTVTEGGSLEYTLDLSSPADSDMTVTLVIDGEEREVIIEKGESTVSFDVKVDANTGGETIKASIKETAGGNFENLTTSGEVSVTIAQADVDGSGSVETADSALGQLTSVDVELDADVSLDTSAKLPTSEYGVFSFDKDGNLQFTQTKPYDHDSADAGKENSKDFTYEVAIKDVNGNTGTATVTVTIEDALPEAEADLAGTIFEGAEASGNLFDNDDFGADGQHSSNHLDLDVIVKVNGVETTWTKDADGNLTNADYGTLKVDSKGNYTFTHADESLGQGETNTFIFDYTITDSDGDTASSTLTVNVTGTDDAAKIEIKDSLVTSDAGLISGVEGSNDLIFDNEDKDTGSFNINDVDGMENGSIVISYNDSNLTISFDEDGKPSFNEGATVEGVHGNLTITGVTPDGNGGYTVTYDYVQDTAMKHDKGTAEGTGENFTITATDGHGGITTGNIDVTIKDAGPDTEHDYRAMTEGDAPITGNLLDNDNGGADGYANSAQGVDGAGENNAFVNWVNPKVTILSDPNEHGTFQSSETVAWTRTDNGFSKDGSVTLTHPDYGTVVIHQDGTYTFDYTSDSLGVGEVVRFDIQYTIADADGDGASASLRVTVEGTDDKAIINITDSLETSDAGLVDDGKDTDTGSFNIKDVDGMENGSIEIALGTGKAIISFDEDGHPTIEDTTVEGMYGNLTITDVIEHQDGSYTVEYEYVQDTAKTHDNVLADGETDPHAEKETGDKFQITVTDAHGSKTSGEVDVTITDDGPIAVDDYAGTILEGTSKSGNVLTNDSFGGDGYEGDSAIVESVSTTVNVNGEETTWTKVGNTLTNDDYGTLTLNADGSYTFKSNPDSINTAEKLEFEFEYTIKDADGDTDTATLTVEVENVALTSPNPGEVTTEDYNLNVAVKVAINLNGLEIDATTLPKSEYGEFSIGKDGNLYFTQTKAYDDPDGTNDGSDKDLDVGQYTVTLKDSNGNTTTTTVDLNIIDDAPVDQTDYDAALGDDGMASAIVEIDFGADSGDGKMLEFGDSKFTFNGESNKWELTEGTGSVSEDGNTLTSGDGTILSNSGSSDLWNVKYDASTDLSETITYTDADGDKADVTLNAEAFEGDVVANDGLATHLAPGTDYNIAIVLDTSGSMYDDYHNGVISSQGVNAAGESTAYVTRLDEACDALRDLANTLYEHAQSNVGGKINVHLGQFWGGSSSESFTLGHDFEEGETLEDQVLELLAAIDAIDHGLQYHPELVQEWDDSKHTESKYVTKIEVQVVTGYELVDGKFEPITETQYYVGDRYGDILYDNPTHAENPDYYDNPFHWHTNFGKGFEDAADWYNSEDVSGNGFQNEVFFMTDGVTSGNTQIGYDKLIDAIGSEGNVNAYGMGSGANESELIKWDNTDGPTMTEDEEIGNMLDPNKGNSTTTPIKSSIAFTTDGNDILMGGISIEKLKAALQEEFPGQKFTDAELALFIKNNPTWIFENVDFDSKIQDPDGLVAGAGDDDLYGQGGNDILIGDGNRDTWAKIADKLMDAEGDAKMSAEDAAQYEYDYLTKDHDTNPETDHTQDLLLEMHQKLSALDPTELAAIAGDLEKANSQDDGDDKLYGGDGDDILFGLGGDDYIDGGEGADIILGGSGNDFILGGAGNDLILGGSGNDTIYGGSGNDTIYLDSTSEAGVERTVTLADGSDFTGNIDDIISFDASDSGSDTIHNFDTDHDLLDLTAFDLKADNLSISKSENGDDAVITFNNAEGASQTITLVGAGEDVTDIQNELGTEDSFIKI